MLAWLLDANRCAACDGPVVGYVAFCGGCGPSVERAPAGRSARFLYGGAIARAIHRYKYEAKDELARPLGDLLAEGVFGIVGVSAFDLVTSVPPARVHLTARGFDHAGLLARRVAVVCDVPYARDALVRLREVRPQATLTRDARARNVVDVFAAHRPSVVGKRVLVVDDVRTTGATLRACEAALRNACAASAVSFVLAEA